jgi:hypothetical protein
MIKRITSFLLGRKAKTKSTDFSDFFRNASANQKKKLFSEVMKEANQDQRDLVKKYETMAAKGLVRQ